MLADPLFHVVLHEPQIPNNTGNIGRTCIALGAALHLIRPLAFDTSAKALRRAGLDYWPRLAPREHADWHAFARDTASTPANTWLTTGRDDLGAIPPWDATLNPGDRLVFGKETAGLPGHILDDHPGRILRFPMLPDERGLNVATAVTALLTEAMRQLERNAHVRIDDRGNITRRRADARS